MVDPSILDRNLLIKELNEALNSKELLNDDIDFIKKLDYLRKECKVQLVFAEDKKPCFGNCLMVTPQICHNNSEMQCIPGHLCHTYCKSCFLTWTLYKIQSNPFAPVFCQRCEIDNIPEKPVITEEFITSCVLSPFYLQAIKNAFASVYGFCCACNQIIELSKCLEFECRHSYCSSHQKDLLARTLDFYKNKIEDKYSDVKSLKFEIKCDCQGKFVLKSSDSLRCILTSNMYSREFGKYEELYGELRDFFINEAKLVRCPSCKNVFQDTDVGDTCLNCSWCTKNDHPGHFGLNCEEFSNIENIYFIDLSRLAYDHSIKGGKISGRLLRQRNLKKIWEVENKYKEIVFSSKKIWKYGFSELITLAEVYEAILIRFSNMYESKLLTYYKNMQEMGSKKYAFFCELRGEMILRVQVEEELASLQDNIIMKINGQYFIRSEEQVRILYLVEIE